MHFSAVFSFSSVIPACLRLPAQMQAGRQAGESWNPGPYCML